MANLQREMINLKNDHASEVRMWRFFAMGTGIVSFIAGGVFTIILGVS